MVELSASGKLDIGRLTTHRFTPDRINEAFETACESNAPARCSSRSRSNDSRDAPRRNLRTTGNRTGCLKTPEDEASSGGQRAALRSRSWIHGHRSLRGRHVGNVVSLHDTRTW